MRPESGGAGVETQNRFGKADRFICLQHAATRTGPSQSSRQLTGVLLEVRVMDIQLWKGCAAVVSDSTSEHNQAASTLGLPLSRVDVRPASNAVEQSTYYPMGPCHGRGRYLGFRGMLGYGT